MTVPESEQNAREGLFSFLSRRKFLKAGLVAGGALLGVGGGGLLILRGRAPEVDGLQVLDAHEYQTVKSLVEIMFRVPMRSRSTWSPWIFRARSTSS